MKPLPRSLLAATTLAVTLPLHLSASEPLARNYQNTISERIRQATAGEGNGVALRLAGRQVLDLTLKQTFKLAQEQSPQLLANNESRTIAESRVLQQDAGLDWVLGATASYSQTSFSERSDDITRERTTGITISGADVEGTGDSDDNNTQTDENGAPILVNDSVGSLLCVTIDGEIVNDTECALQTEITTETEFAAFDADSTNAFNLGLTGSKQFGLGSLLTAGLGLAHRTKNFYPLDDAGLISPISTSDPIGNGSRYPWTSRLFVEYLTPLPFGKGYGPDGSAVALGQALARIGDRQSRHTELAVQQSLLQQIGNSYWSLVSAVLQLHAAENTRANLEKRLASAERQYRARSLTNYELSQVQSALAAARASEQSAWVAYISGSDNLTALLGLEQSAVIVPAGFHEAVVSSERLNRQSELNITLRENPGVNASRVAVESSEVLVRNAQQNLKHDVNVVAGFEFSQTDRVLGYEDAFDSLTNVLDPDNSRWFVGLRYTLPLGRHADKARKQQAEAGLMQARNRVIQDEINLAAELNALVAGNNASLILAANAESQLELAEQAFERGTRARSNGSVSEFEYLQIVDDLDAARNNWISRMVDQQRIRVSLQALQGSLGQQGEAE